MNSSQPVRAAAWTPPPRPEWVSRVNEEGSFLDIPSVVPLDDEPVPFAHLGDGRSGAEFPLLDRAARDADQVMMMAGLAGDEAAAVEPPHLLFPLEQRERAVDRGEADRRGPAGVGP